MDINVEKKHQQKKMNNRDNQVIRTILSSNKEWYNDLVINCFTSHINKRFGPSYFATNTFFVPVIQSRGPEEASKYLPDRPSDVLFVPVHVTGHWVLFVINFNARNVSFKDNKTNHKKFAIEVAKYILKVCKHKYKLKETGWKLRLLNFKHHNGNDCGPIVCAHILNEVCPFEEDLIKQCRVKTREFLLPCVQ